DLHGKAAAVRRALSGDVGIRVNDEAVLSMLANQLSQLARQGCAMAGSVLVVGVVLAGSPAQAGAAAQTGTGAQAGAAGTRTTRTRTAVHAGAAARGPGTTAASASLDLKRISYRGYTFRVPRSWPIINV